MSDSLLRRIIFGGGVKLKYEFNGLMSLFFLMVCICMFIGSSCIYASDIDNVTSSEEVNIDSDNDSNVISADFNQIDDSLFSLENYSDEFIDNDMFVVDFQLLLCSYSEDYNNPVECGGFVSDNSLIGTVSDDITNTCELIGCSLITEDSVKIQNLTFTNSLPSNAGVSNGCLCGNVMSPMCFGDNGCIPICVFSCNTSTDGNAIYSSGKNFFSPNSMFVKISAFNVASEIYGHGANYTICNTFSVNSSSELSRESIHYNRNRKNLNITSSFEDGFTRFNSYGMDLNVNHYNSSDTIGGVPITYIISSSIMNGTVNAGSCLINSNGFALTVNGTLNDFEISLTKDVFGGIYAFLFNEDYSNVFSLVKSTYHYNMQCEVFGINPVYLLEYEGITANNFTCNYTDNLNTIFSKFDLADCSSHRDFHKAFLLSTIFKESYAVCFNSVGNFSSFYLNTFKLRASAILFGEDENERVIVANSIVFSACKVVAGDFNSDIDALASYSLLDTLSLNNSGMNNCIKIILGASIINRGHCYVL